VPKVSQEHMDARRQQILAAAVVCFARKGIHGSSMADICRESSLSAGAIYRHFASKQAIVEAAFELYTAEVGDMWARIAEYDDVLEGMLAMLELTFAWFDDPKALFGMRQGVLMHAEALFDPRIAELSAAMHTRFVHQLTALVATAQAQGRINPDLDPQAVARLFFSIYDGFRMQKLMERQVETGPYIALLRALLEGEHLGLPKAG
jgi:AcrR family transcriptional regulator